MAETAEPAPEAEDLYARILGEPSDRRSVRLEELCRSHPDLAAELRRLWADGERAQAALAGLVNVQRAVGRDRRASLSAALEHLGRPDDPSAYEDRGPVARGGMGEVRRVRDGRLARTLAMKVLPLPVRDGAPSAGQVRRIERFLDEARIAGGLQHPAIVPVHALGITGDGRLYFTMPLIEGEDLDRIFARARGGDSEWTRSRAVGVIVRVCEAMAFAHSHGVVHRDLKPANVMVGRYGEVHVVDWGLATVLGAEGAADIRPRIPGRVPGEAQVGAELRTMDGDVIGTPCYMPPEQAAGHVDDVGVSSDVYAVGAMLYHLLSGRAPYSRADGSSSTALEVLARVRREPPESLRDAAPDAPPELVAICERAMQRGPDRRYPDMPALAADLRAWLDGRVVHAYETGAWAELRKWVRRNRGLAGSLGGVLLALIAGLAGIAIVRARSERDLRDVNFDLEAANAVAEGRLESLERSLYFNNVALAQNALESFNTVDLRALLESCPADLRGWEWRYLWRLSDTSSATLRHGELVVDVAFTPDGGRLVSGDHDGTVAVWDVAEGTRQYLFEGHADLVEAVDVSPDGALVASAGRDHTVRVWDLDTGAEQIRLEGHRDIVRDVAFGPAGARLVSGSFDDAVLVWDLDSGRSRRLPGHQSDVLGVDWSSDGRHIAAGSFDGKLTVWEADSGALLHEIPAGGEFRVNRVRFSPDGRWLATASQDRERVIWDVETGQALLRVPTRTGAYPVDFTPDGGSLLTAELGAVQVWDVESAEETLALFGHSAQIYAVTSSPDGGLLASGAADGTVRLWDATRDPTRLALPAGGGNVHAIAFDPDGCRLVWGGRAGTIQIRDAASGARLAGWDSGQVWVVSLAFHPDGTHLASGGADGTIRLWEAATGRLLWSLRAHDNWVRSIFFDATGERFVSSSEDGTARTWDFARRSELCRMQHDRGIVRAELDPSGARLLTSCWGGLVKVTDAETGRLELEIEAHPGTATFASFSPDGRRIASGGGDRALRVWDAATGVQLFAAHGHEHSVTSARYSGDGERIYTCGWDGMFKVWDARTGTLAMTLRGDEHPLRNLDVSPDGEHIAVCGVGKTAYVWSAGRPDARSESGRPAAASR